LDALIAPHGLPRFCKIDVEGYEVRTEPRAPRGRAPRHLARRRHILERQGGDRLREPAQHFRLGFNATIGERRRFVWREWRPAVALDAWLAARRADEPSGDFYARLEDRDRE
jgi:hypothetical protein